MKKILNLIALAFIFLLSQEAMAQCDAEFYYYQNGSGTYTFYDSVGSNYTTDKWTFGDGNTGNAQRGQVSHTYKSTGKYTVCRIIWDSVNSCRDTFCTTINYQQCKASFTYTITSDTVEFTNTSGSHVMSSWSFGDGNSSTARNPKHIYRVSSPKTFNVCLSTWDSSRTCWDRVCKTITVQPHGYKSCYAYFNIVQKGDTVYFMDSSDNATTYSWKFGDGSTSGARNPVHVYQPNRQYTACLTITDTTGMCSKSYCRTIRTQSNTTCDADFTTSIRGKIAAFTPNTSKSGVSYSWDFGDSSYSNSTNPTHTYSLNGNSSWSYRACLTIYDSATQCTDTKCRYITVYDDSCYANYTYQVYGYSVYFYNRSTGTPGTTYSWSFGDGGTSSTKHPYYTYNRQGQYYVCLTVSDTNNNCSITYCDTIQVDSVVPCSANFGYFVQDSNVYIQNSSQGSGLSYYWTTSNSMTSTAQNPTFSFSTPGTYTICLFVTDSLKSCTDSICKSVTIDSAKNCMAFFRVAIDTTQKFKLFLINGSSNKSTHSYYWSFGDGGSSTQRNPSHKYTSFGKYNVCLTVVDSANRCSDTFCDSLGLDSNGRMLKADGFELQVLEDNLSIGKRPEVNFAMYPNPVSDVVNFKLSGTYTRGARVEIYSVDGRLVEQKSLELSGETTLDMSTQNNGMYVVRIYDGTNYAQTKLVKMSR